jgi:hypothetical protein
MAGIRLISKEERLTLQVTQEGRTAKFFYRRLPADVRARCIKENTERGITDAEGALTAALKYCLYGWEGFLDQQDEPVQYDAELVVILPSDLRQELATAVGGVGGPEDDSGNRAKP